MPFPTWEEAWGEAVGRHGGLLWQELPGFPHSFTPAQTCALSCLVPRPP